MTEVRVRYANGYAIGTRGYANRGPADGAGTRKVHAGTRNWQKGTRGTRFYKKRTRVPAVPKPCAGGWIGTLPLDRLARRRHSEPPVCRHSLRKRPMPSANEYPHPSRGTDMTGPVKQTAQKRKVGDGTPGPGRKKGVPNKTTRTVKEAISLAAEGLGGWDEHRHYARVRARESGKLPARNGAVDGSMFKTGGCK